MILTELQEMEIKLKATEKVLAELQRVVAERISATINSEMQKENDRLRKALERIVADDDDTGMWPEEIAQQALDGSNIEDDRRRSH